MNSCSDLKFQENVKVIFSTKFNSCQSYFNVPMRPVLARF